MRLKLAEAKDARGTLEARTKALEVREAAAAAKEQALAAQVTALAADRAALDQRDESPADPKPKAPSASAKRLEARELKLAARAEELGQRETALAEREQELVARAAELDEREAVLAARPEEAEPVVGAGPVPDELERIETKLAELRTAEQAFARTHAELAKRSDALAEQEAGLAARERALAAKEAPSGGDLDALEARIRRLEQGGRKREAEPQTFSAGLRALQERGLRSGRLPDEPLH